MTPSPAQPSWTPLSLLGERFAANLRALATRRPPLAELLRTLAPVQQYFLQPHPEHVQMGVATAAGVQPLANSLSPAAAAQIAKKLCPTNACTSPLLIVGEGVGWLWNSLYNLPCYVPSAPGHRPPLYFLIGSLERLWLMLHLQDWTQLLADPRVRLFIGPSAAAEFRQSLISDTGCPWPRTSIVVDPALWPAGLTLDGLLKDAGVELSQKYARLEQQLATTQTATSPIELAERLRDAGRPLRILGITSRYTTFLQYSMRDWLSAFERLGHQTKLIIEQADHEITGPMEFAQASLEFRPDLIVCIDHFRKELAGLPANVPVAMWVQDALPNIFSPASGAAQGPLDYCLGFGKLKLTGEFGYPAQRYMPAIVGLNEDRFTPRTLSRAERERFGGDVAFVSHASTPAEQIIADEVRKLGSPDAAKLLWAIYEQLRAIYDGGGAIVEPIAIRRLIEQTMRDTQVGVPASQMPSLIDLFLLRVNNALFRHQSLLWLADMDVDLRLWGRGWEQHPKLARFARGVADNDSQLPAIYQASRVNLQVTPHGAVDQRAMEGLAAGGFFLIRQVVGDLLEREYQAIWQWCQEHGITNDAELQCRATPVIQQRLAAVAEMLQHSPFEAADGNNQRDSFVAQLQGSAQDGYIRSAGTVWGDDYDAVSYRSADELRAKVTHYLANEEERSDIAASMRQVVLDRFTYAATTKRLLNFIADDLTSRDTGSQPVPSSSRDRGVSSVPTSPKLDLSLDLTALRSRAAGTGGTPVSRIAV